MATDRLKIYSGALLLCGELRLDSLSENREARHLLDLVWNDGGVRACLEQAQWHFAMRTAEFSYDTSVEPAFGYSRAFDKPDDWVLTSGIFTDEYLNIPLTAYWDEADYWYADHDTIYVRYISDDDAYGMDFAKWPATFTDYVKAYFAGRICHKLPNAEEKIKRLHGTPGTADKGLIEKFLIIAKNKSAMTGPTTFPQRGTWARARHAGLSRSRDGGSTTNLTG